MGPELHKRFDEAVTAALAGATVVTATTRSARMLLHEAVRRLRTGKLAVRTPDVLPLDAFCRRLWGDALSAGAVSEALLSEARAQALWRNIISQSRHGSAMLNARGSARMAQDAWRTAHAYRIPLAAKAFSDTAESSAFSEWASLFREQSRRAGWVDAAVLPDRLAARAGDLAAVLPKHLVFYGFVDLTPQSRQLARALTTCGMRIETITIDARPAAHAITVAAADATEELRLAARWARCELLANSSARIGIVVPELRAIRAAVAAALAEVLHPEEFLSPAISRDRVFEVAAGQPLDGYALVRDALLTLRFAFGEIPTIDAGVLLRSPYIGDATEASDRALFDVTLRRFGRAQYSAKSLLESPGHVRILSPPGQLARALRKLANLSPPRTKLLHASETADLFHAALEAARWPGRELDSTEYQARERWEDLLGEFASLDGFLPATTAAASVEELARMATGISFRPENSGAPVQVMDEDEAAGAVFDRLWVCGMTDEWPRRSRPNPYLPLPLQREAGVPNLSPQQQHASAAATLARYTATAEQVVFSWARQDKERELRANRLLTAFAPEDPARLCGPPAPSCVSMQRAAAEQEYRNDRNAPAADPEKLPHRSTEVLKYQAHCPFRAFAQLRLGAQKLELPELGTDRRVRGGLVERALQAFWIEVRDSVNLRALLPREEIDAVFHRAVEKAFEELPESDHPWDARVRALERRRLRALLKKWSDVELARADFEVMLEEQQAEIDVPLGSIVIHGRVDRIDRVRGGGFVVLDYKSGLAPKPSDWASDRPEEPQLPLYVVDQLDHGREVSGIAFAHVAAGKPAFKGYGRTPSILGFKHDNLRRYLNGDSFDAHIRRWRPTLERLAAEFVAGAAAVDPKRPTLTCGRCHLHSLCRVAEVDFGAREADSEDGGDDE